MLPPYIRTGRLTVWDEDIEIDSAPPYVLPLTTAWNAPIGLDALTPSLPGLDFGTAHEHTGPLTAR